MAADLRWVNVSKASPCTICGKSDWCRFTSGGEITDCMRDCGVGSVQKVDKIGQVFFRHFASSNTGKDGDHGGHVRADVDVEAPLRNHKKRGEPDLLHAVYTALLDTLVLYDRHVEHLTQDRKFTPAHLQRLGYRSFPSTRFEQQNVVDVLLSKFTEEQLTSVPGFDKPRREPIELAGGGTVDPTEIRICGCDGILLPQRDADGKILALVLRRDIPDPKPDDIHTKTLSRYLPFTSYDDSGAAASVGVHVSLHDPTTRKTIRVIEGIIKADTATEKTGILTVGIPSGSRWRTGIKLAEDLGADEIIITPDGDTQTNKGICMTLVHACHDLAARGGAFRLEAWDPGHGKGLDDVLNAKHGDKVKMHEGTGAWKLLKHWLASCGADRDLRVESRIVLDDIVNNVKSDPTYVFRPNMAEALAVLDPATVEAQRIFGPIKKALKHSGSSWGDLEKRIEKARSKLAKAETNAKLNEQVKAGKTVFTRGDEAELSLALLDDLTPISGGWKSNHELAAFDGGKLHIYNVDTGVYEPIEDAKLIKRVADYAGSSIAGESILRVSNNSARGSVKLAQARQSKPGFFNDAPMGVAFKNGFLAVDPLAKKVALVSHSPKNRVRHTYNFNFEHGRVPKKFLKALDRWFQNKAEKADFIACIQEYVGASIVGMASTFQKVIILKGKGNDGKSTLARIIIAAMPEGSVTSIAPQAFDREFSRAELASSLLNVVSELPEGDLLDSGPAKAVIVGDPIEARHPYGAPFTLRCRAGQLWICNTLFRTKDVTDAFKRRFILLEFDNPIGTVEGEVPNEHLADEIIAEEIPAIVSWAIEGLMRRMKSSKYTTPAASDAAVAEWIGECDTVGQFIAARLVELSADDKPDAKKWTKGSDIYPEYKQWCKDEGHQAMSSTKFFTKLRTSLKMGKKEGHKNDGNYYPVTLRAAADLQARIRQAMREDAELDAFMKSLDLSTPVPNPTIGDVDIDEDDSDEAARRIAYRSVYGREEEDDVALN